MCYYNVILYISHHFVIIQPSNPIQNLVGHVEHVMSTDFHPTKLNLLTSCDSNDDIILWDVSKGDCKLIFKVGALKFLPFFKILILIMRYLYLIYKIWYLTFSYVSISIWWLLNYWILNHCWIFFFMTSCIWLYEMFFSLFLLLHFEQFQGFQVSSRSSCEYTYKYIVLEIKGFHNVI